MAIEFGKLDFRQGYTPEPPKREAVVNVNHRRGNSLATVTELTPGELYSVAFPFLHPWEASKLLDAWEALVKAR